MELVENQSETKEKGGKKAVAHSSCCTPDEQPSERSSSHHHHGHDHDHGDPKMIFRRGLISLLLLIPGIYWTYFQTPDWFEDPLRFAFFLLAYLPVGLPVLRDAWKEIRHGAFFSEFFLMGIATIGAFVIGEYPEAVAVMLFYTIGEGFQSLAVEHGHKNIQNLLDQRPDEATIIKNKKPHRVKTTAIKIGDIIQLKPGEKLGLDGELLTEKATFDTRALTGESKPDTRLKGESVLAGMVNGNTPAKIQVTAAYQDSKLSQILKLVGEASSQKAPTERFIQKFAKIYTPIVVYAAIAITFIPFLFVADYHFHDWLYRALIFLVVSCPCALVISIPLGYFGGIGAASRNGILVKGGNYLDVLADLDQMVMDKTGTLTKGVFKVQKAAFEEGADQEQLLRLINALESHSTHPIASAVQEYVGKPDSTIDFQEIEEVPGHGLAAFYNGKRLLVGNFRLLDKHRISYSTDPESIVETVIAIAYDGKFEGYLTISDELKPGTVKTIKRLKKLKVTPTLLSGDKKTLVQKVAGDVGIANYSGELLPDEKVDYVKSLKILGKTVGFVGDGFNDAPVIALSDVGMAMGGLGSDAAIEVADVVIQDDQVHRIPMAIKIGKKTRAIVWQNIGLAFGIKLLVLILGAFGMATMWEAVFADVGVALLAILNAFRLQKMSFEE